MNQKPALFLLGPTAMGKTDLALSLAEYLPVEIVSVDSAMIYRGMDIGTGKPHTTILERIPHHLISIRDPLDTYSCAEFRKDALFLQNDIRSRGHLPVFVGGTMLYFKALVSGLDDLPHSSLELRLKLQQEANQIGWPEMHAKLATVDAESAARIHPNDPQRIERALSVYELTGKPLSQLVNKKNDKPEISMKIFALIPTDRKILHQRIEERFHNMLSAGFVSEVEALFKRGDLTPDLPALRAVGYRQIWAYLEQRLNYTGMISQTLAATRQLAKRQLTWLRSLSQEFEIEILENNNRASLQSMIDFAL